MRDMVSTLNLIYDHERCQVIHPNSCLSVFYHTQYSPNYLITSLWPLEDMPGILYRNLNIGMLSIKTSGDFYLFYAFPYGRILTLFMWYLGTLNIANIRNAKTNKIFQEIYRYCCSTIMQMQRRILSFSMKIFSIISFRDSTKWHLPRNDVIMVIWMPRAFRGIIQLI